MIRPVDKLPLKSNIPTPEEIKPPIPICINPNKAEALPAFLENGASATAAALGKPSPTQKRMIKRKTMIHIRPFLEYNSLFRVCL
jgi:hypothetical protein